VHFSFVRHDSGFYAAAAFRARTVSHDHSNTATRLHQNGIEQ
jgi:hypothetical protein